MSSNNSFRNKITDKLFDYKSYVYIKTAFDIKWATRVDIPLSIINQPTNQRYIYIYIYIERERTKFLYSIHFYI